MVCNVFNRLAANWGPFGPLNLLRNWTHCKPTNWPDGRDVITPWHDRLIIVIDLVIQVINSSDVSQTTTTARIGLRRPHARAIDEPAERGEIIPTIRSATSAGMAIRSSAAFASLASPGASSTSGTPRTAPPSGHPHVGLQASSLPRAQEYPAHRPLHGTGAEPLQRFLAV